MHRRLEQGLIALAIIVVLRVPANAQSLRPLFVATTPAQSIAAFDLTGANSAFDQRTVVGMRLDALFSNANAQTRVLLNAGGREWVAQLQHIDTDANGFRSWVGEIEGIQYSHVVFTERDGVVSGLIDAVGDSYRVRTASPGTYFLEHLNALATRGDGEPLIGAASGRGFAADGLQAAADDGTTIDVLLLYTANARAAAGGDTQVQSVASQIISDTNTIFTRSGIRPRVRLAGTAAFSLTEAATMASDLNALTASATARTLRDSYHADLVQLLVSSPDRTACGLGWLLTSLSSTNFDAYSVVDVECVPQYSPTHEMGHNMGSHHAPEDGASGALFPYSYGYKDPARGFRTVMASACSTGSCSRIANFSNPAVFNNGYTTGSTTQNNTLSINNAALTVANWRQAAASAGGTGGTGGTGNAGGSTGGAGGTGAVTASPWTATGTVSGSTITATWGVPPGGFVPVIYQVEILNALNGFTVALVNVGTAQFFSTSLPNGPYVLRVRALNASGAVQTTTDVAFTVGPPLTSTPPQAPLDLRVDMTGSLVTLTWNMNLSSPGARSFMIDVGTAPSLSNLGSYDTGSTAMRLVTTAPLPGVYYVRVRAQNAFGASPASNEVVLSVGGSRSCAGPPAAPLGLAATVAGSFVTLNWTYPLTTSPVSGYRLEVGSAPGLANLLQYPLGVTGVFGGYAPSGVYYARVRAINGCGQSGPSNEIVVSVP